MINYLVSYGHSGNTWVRYCIEYLTKKPTHGYRDFSISERRNNSLRINIADSPVVIKRHDADDICDDDNFTLLIRSPYDCIKSDQNVNTEFLKYYSLIQGYDLHNGPKQVIYFKSIFVKSWIRDFASKNKLFGTKLYTTRVNDLIANWEWHQLECLNIYNNKTKKEGADLSAIPHIYFEHELVKNACNTFHF